MPVNRGLDVEVVLDEYFDVVSFVRVDQGPRMLAIDKVYFALESIWQ